MVPAVIVISKALQIENYALSSSYYHYFSFYYYLLRSEHGIEPTLMTKRKRSAKPTVLGELDQMAVDIYLIYRNFEIDFKHGLYLIHKRCSETCCDCDGLEYFNEIIQFNKLTTFLNKYIAY